MKWAEKYEDTLWSNSIKPVFDYISRVAELIILAAVCRVAADQTESLVLDVFAAVMIIIVGGYAGFPVGYLFQAGSKVKTKDWRIAVAVALPLGLIVAGGAFILGIEVSEAIRAIASLEVK